MNRISHLILALFIGSATLVEAGSLSNAASDSCAVMLKHLDGFAAIVEEFYPEQFDYHHYDEMFSVGLNAHRELLSSSLRVQRSFCVSKFQEEPSVETAAKILSLQRTIQHKMDSMLFFVPYLHLREEADRNFVDEMYSRSQSLERAVEKTLPVFWAYLRRADALLRAHGVDP